MEPPQRVSLKLVNENMALSYTYRYFGRISVSGVNVGIYMDCIRFYEHNFELSDIYIGKIIAPSKKHHLFCNHKTLINSYQSGVVADNFRQNITKGGDGQNDNELLWTFYFYLMPIWFVSMYGKLTVRIYLGQYTWSSQQQEWFIHLW